MPEEVASPSVSGAVQSTPMDTLNDELTPKADNPQETLGVGGMYVAGVSLFFEGVGSLVDLTKSAVNVGTKSTEDGLALKVSQLTKELEESRRECDRYKMAQSNSEAEKESLITKMESKVKLKSAEIENLKIAHLHSETEKKELITKMENESELKSAEIENLKIAHVQSEVEKESLLTIIEHVTKLKSEVIENLKLVGQFEKNNLVAELNAMKSAMTRMENEIKVKTREIELLKASRDASARGSTNAVTDDGMSRSLPQRILMDFDWEPTLLYSKSNLNLSMMNDKERSYIEVNNSGNPRVMEERSEEESSGAIALTSFLRLPPSPIAN